MYSESDLLPLSALQHLSFCERQWGLIHLEQQWAENRLTAEGRLLHERVHEQESESRGAVRIVRGLHIRSLRLGLTGIADVVEFHREASGAYPSKPEAGFHPNAPKAGASGAPGLLGAPVDRPFPVEYKRGRPKPDRCDEVQLCAQGLCLEEMTGHQVVAGAIFYGQPRRRLEVSLDSHLRGETEALARRLHELQQAARTPPPAYGSRCKRCSLVDICLPLAAQKPASAYLRRAVRRALQADAEGP
jgi:CRISPR-associated exonuclease Cas4